MSKLLGLFQRLVVTMPGTTPVKNSTVTSSLEKPSPKKLKVDDVEMKGDEKDEKLDMLLVAKLSEHATIPTRGSPLAAGYDLYSAQVGLK